MARYYPNGSNRKRTPKENANQKDNNDATLDFFKDYTIPGQGFQNLDSLYRVFTTGKVSSERDYWIYSVANSIPGLSGYLQGMGQYQDLKSYMEHYGLTWDDVKPWRIANTGAGAFYRQTTNFIGDMVKELYS